MNTTAFPTARAAARAGAYASQTPAQVRATLRELRAYRDYVADPRITEEYEVKDPRNWGWTLNKPKIRARLTFYLHTAINRKAGLPDHPLNHRGQPARNWSTNEWWRMKRDQRALHDRISQRVMVRRFETREAQRRFGHLLADREEHSPAFAAPRRRVRPLRLSRATCPINRDQDLLVSAVPVLLAIAEEVASWPGRDGESTLIDQARAVIAQVSRGERR